MPLMSIIVPVYNAENVVERCITSLLCQNYSDFEIILVNDGSTDNSAEICEKFQKKNSNISYLSQTNKGVSAARNLGIKAAKGAWLVFVDADDIVTNNMCSLIKSNIDIDTDLMLFDFKEFSQETIKFKEDKVVDYEVYCYSQKDKNVLQKKAFGYTKDLPEVKTSLRTPWAKAYRSKFLNNYKLHYPMDIRMGQDFLFNLRVLEHIAKIKYIKTTTYYYYYNSGSTTHRYKPDMEKIDRGFYAALDMHMQNFSDKEDLELPYYASVLDGLLLYLKYYYFHPKNRDSISFIKKDINRLISSSPYQQAIANSKNRFFKEHFSLSKRIIIFLIKRENIVGLSGIYKFSNIVNRVK